MVPVAKRIAPAESLSVPGLHAHVPELDGIRGIAVALVVFFHLSLLGGIGANSFYRPIAAVGWSGVDLFFVLSGLLITGILLDSRADRRYFQKFYARRVLRIFPLYYAVVAGLFLLAPLLLDLLSRGRMISFWVQPESQFFAWIFALNILFAIPHAGFSPLIHPLWSLAVEEQFYLAWPLVVRRLAKVRLGRICVGLIFAALAIRTVFAIAGNSPAAYALTPCRFDALAMGGLLAVTLRSENAMPLLRTWSWKLAAASLAAFAVVGLTRGLDFKDPVVVTAGISLLDLFFASSLAAILSAPAESVIRSPFRSSALRTVGKYSYAIYIFHQAIIIGLCTKNLPSLLIARLHSKLFADIAFSTLACALSFAAALASWWLIEKRFLALKRVFQY